MNDDTIVQLIANNTALTDILSQTNETISRLSKINGEAIALTKISEQRREQLLTICIQIYDSLSHKEKRDLEQECWHRSLLVALKIKE